MKTIFFSNNDKALRKERMGVVIMRVVVPGYLGLLALLLAIDFMVIGSTRREDERRLGEAVTRLADRIDSETQAVNRYLYDVYENDENFRRLGGEKDASKAFSYAADLNARLSGYSAINRVSDGYFVIYGDSAASATSMGTSNPQRILPDDKRQMEALLKNNLGLSGSYEAFCYTPQADSYQLLLYRRGRACIALVRNLSLMAGDLQNAYPEFESVTVTDFISAEESVRDSLVFSAEAGSGGPLIRAEVSRSYLHRLTGLQIFLLAMTALSFAGAILLYLILDRQMIRPLHRVVEEMEQLSRGEISDLPDIQVRYYEMQLMIDTLRSTIRELRRQEESVYQEQLLRKETELQLAYTQLKPHFFLNCLKTLYVLAVKSKSPQMQDIILKISDHLRYLIDINRRVVTVKEEVWFTQNYVDLQNALKSRKISLAADVDESLLPVEIPLLCIQLFVENSVKYAQLESDEDTLQLVLSVQLLESEGKRYVDITVSDNGRGYDEDYIEAFNRGEDPAGHGIGISNIRHRCALIYGQGAECVLYNMNGAVSELLLPLEKHAEGGGET